MDARKRTLVCLDGVLDMSTGVVDETGRFGHGPMVPCHNFVLRAPGLWVIERSLGRMEHNLRTVGHESEYSLNIGEI